MAQLRSIYSDASLKQTLILCIGMAGGPEQIIIDYYGGKTEEAFEYITELMQDQVDAEPEERWMRFVKGRRPDGSTFFPVSKTFFPQLYPLYENLLKGYQYTIKLLGGCHLDENHYRRACIVEFNYYQLRRKFQQLIDKDDEFLRFVNEDSVLVIRDFTRELCHRK